MIPNRRRNEVLEGLIASGGSENYGSAPSSDTQGAKRFPSSFNRIIQYMLEIYYKIQDMVATDIPNAFPSTEPKVRRDARYTHDDAESFFARPVTIINDANAALEVCARIKEYVNVAKALFDNFFPKRIENPSFLTEVRDGFQADIELLNSFLENIEKIQNLLLRSKMSGLNMTINRQDVEKLRQHIVKIGYDTKVNGKKLVEVFPNVIAVRQNAVTDDSLSSRNIQELNDVDNVAGRLGVDDLMCKLSDRLIDYVKKEKRGDPYG